MRRSRLVSTIGTLALVITACERGPEHAIVPLPASVERSSGSFTLDATTAITLRDASDPELRRVAELWAAPFREQAGLALPIAETGAIRLSVDGEGEPEAYRLDVSADGVTIVGSDHAGLFYGLQSLSQLLPPGAETGDAPLSEGLRIDAISVVDAPRLPYRGMHLDVARHFYGSDFVKHYIDLLARYKINRFHWHLTDDQGWRIEIDAYPRLTEVGAYREQTHVGHGDDPFQGDGERYGGFYTKDEIRDVVAYAQDRFVMVIPEIEMPGHAAAALAAYPELACTEGPFEVAMTWGVFEDIFCPTEETFEFLETVMGEVAELFPGEYLHIGGDEAPKTRWEESDYVQALMQREGFADVEQVQRWFIRRIAGFLDSKGKRLIGWDEILEGGPGGSPPSNATVMSWRGILGGIEASRMGLDVVMTPYSHLYFDYYQSEDREREPFAIGGFLPLDTVYAYDPVPEQLRPRDAARIIGVQANLWTEYVKTPEHVEYMLMPRLLALSEVAWSPKEAKDYESFRDRIDWHLERLDALGVNYREPDR